MRLTQHIVVGIVGRCHLQTTRTELDIHITVLDNRNHTVHQRYDDLLALQPLVLRVLRVDTHGGITHDGLRTGGSYHGIAVTAFHIVFQVVQLRLLFLIDHLFGRKSRQCLGVPVHHAKSTVDISLVVKVHKHLDNALRTLLVHRKGGTVPIARSTQSAQLLQNDATVFVGPFPCMFQELFTGQVMLLDALLSQLLHYLSLGSDRGMVCARHPTGVLAFHACPAHQDILNRVVQHVSHVEHTRHIGRWDNDGVGFTSIGFRGEQFVVQPVLIPFRFDLFWVVFTC